MSPAWASGCPRRPRPPSPTQAAPSSPGWPAPCCLPPTRSRWRRPGPGWLSAATSPDLCRRAPLARAAAPGHPPRRTSIMASLRTWRTAAATLLLVALATTSTTAAARTRTPGNQHAHYCKRVDAYRLKTCATALLPAGPLGRQLRWGLAQLAGEAATLTEAEVRAHFSAEFLTVMFPPEVVIQFFQQNLAERGPFTFIGFAYPPRARQALAIVEGPTGERGALPIGVTSGRPALIEYLDLQAAPPTVVPKGRFSGWFDIGGRRLFLRCTGHGSPTVVFESHLTHDW